MHAVNGEEHAMEELLVQVVHLEWIPYRNAMEGEHHIELLDLSMGVALF